MNLAIIPCIGLGDGLISCVLAHNLALAGHNVKIFHSLLPQLSSFFPTLSFAERPREIDEFKNYEKLIFFYEKLPWMQKAIETFPEKRIILNPIATSNRDYPYWEEGGFDGTRPFVENLVAYAEKKWGIEEATKENGIIIPDHLQWRKHEERVIIHPTSSRPGKNWTKEKYLQLAKKLEKQGFISVFILTPEEKKDWPEVNTPTFHNLSELAEYIAESGYMIGNDSGIGHLASCLGIPTLTICRSSMGANFWRPSWAFGKVVIPPAWIPNIKGFRWRDKKWQYFVSVETVYHTFLNLVSDFSEAGVLSY